LTAPIFILCAGRSGSTLLRFLLDAHPEVACPPETKLSGLCTQLTAAWALFDRVTVSANGAHERPGPSETVIDGVRQTLDSMLVPYLERRGKTRYCDKSLGSAAHATLLQRIFPDVKFLCLYRHPMDLINSGMEACPWGLAGYGFDSYGAADPGNSVLALAKFWADHASKIAGVEDRFPDQCHRVRYEDLVLDPEGEAARIFEFLGVAPAPGITDRCFTFDRERFGPADYKIWNTTRISADSVGKGWSVPARLIGAPVRTRVNKLADRLGYLRVDDDWGVGGRPADLRVVTAGQEPKEVISEHLGARLHAGTRLIYDRVHAGLSLNGEQFRRRWGPRSGESLLLIATALPHADAWWRVDLGTGTATAGVGRRPGDTDWSVTGSADAWERVLRDETNLGVAFRCGDLRYHGTGDAGAGTFTADTRVAMMAELLGITRWLPAGRNGHTVPAGSVAKQLSDHPSSGAR
jgi:Sulfotransferase family